MLKNIEEDLDKAETLTLKTCQIGSFYSKYEDYNLIVFTSYKPEDPPEDLADIKMLTFIPNCIVYEYEGGYFDWEES